MIKAYQEDKAANEDEFVSMFNLLITNIIKTFNFSIEEDDARQECFFLILRILPNFDTSKGTAFNYFTTTIKNQLSLMYTKNKKYSEKMAMYEMIISERES